MFRDVVDFGVGVDIEGVAGAAAGDEAGDEQLVAQQKWRRRRRRGRVILACRRTRRLQTWRLSV